MAGATTNQIRKLKKEQGGCTIPMHEINAGAFPEGRNQIFGGVRMPGVRGQGSDSIEDVCGACLVDTTITGQEKEILNRNPDKKDLKSFFESLRKPKTK